MEPQPVAWPPPIDPDFLGNRRVNRIVSILFTSGQTNGAISDHAPGACPCQAEMGTAVAEPITITEEMIYAGAKVILNELDSECGFGLSVLKAEIAAREVLRCALEVGSRGVAPEAYSARLPGPLPAELQKCRV